MAGALFGALTEVHFSDTLGGTRLDVTQSYTVLDPEAAWMAEGAPQGWAQTLDNLSAEVLRRADGARRRTRRLHRRADLRRSGRARLAGIVGRRSESEMVRRDRPASGARSSAAWTSASAGPSAPEGRWKNGVVSDFDAVYHDIVPDARIVYSYTMHLNEAKISVSLATMELKADGPRPDDPEGDGAGRLSRRLRRRRLARARHGFLLDKLGNP